MFLRQACHCHSYSFRLLNYDLNDFSAHSELPLKRAAPTFMLTTKRCVVVHTGEAECCKHGNKYLICFVCAEKIHCVYQMFVLSTEPARQHEWFTVQLRLVSFQRKCPQLLLDNNYQQPPITCLLSLFTQVQLWEITNQYLIPGLIFALWKRKSLSSPFHPHTYSLSHCVCVRWLNISSFLSAYSGWKEWRELSFIPIIYSYYPGETAV